MAEGVTCYERDEELCEDQMCLRVGCRLRNERLTTPPMTAAPGMVERVSTVIALALAEAYAEREEPTPEDHERAARAAIEAMRDNPPNGFEKIVYHGDYGDDVWRDSIDAALKGEG